MGYMILQFRMTLARQFRSSRGRIFLLLAAVLTAAALLIPSDPPATAVEVGVVLPRSGADALMELLQQRGDPVVRFLPADEETLDRKILSGQWDCGLVIPEDFSRRLERMDTRKLITLKTGPASTVWPLVQEAAASCLMELLSPRVAGSYLEEAGMDPALLESRMDSLKDSTARVEVTLQTLSGTQIQPLSLKKSGTDRIFRGLIALFSLIWCLYLAADLGNWLRSGSALRLRTVRPVTQLLLPRLAASMLPLLCWGSLLLVILTGQMTMVVRFSAYLFLLGALGLILPRFSGLWQSILAAMPFLVVASLLLEPVLLDVNLLFPGISRWLGWLPVTLFLRSCDGSDASLLVLLAEGMVLILLSLRLDRQQT